MYPSHKLATQTQRTTIRRLVKTRLLWTTIQASALLVYLIPHRPRTDDGGGRLLNWQRVPNDSAGTSVGFVRTAIVGNCCCYYLDCCTHYCWGWHTEPFPPEDRGFGCRIEGQPCCQRRQADTRSEGVEDVGALARGHQLTVASVRRRELRGHHSRERAAARRHGVAPRQPCGQPLPPSSWPSIPCEFP